MPVSKAFLQKKCRTTQRSIAARGGRLVNNAYESVNAPLTVECMRGHLFEASPKNIFRTWCPACHALDQKEMKIHLYARCSDWAKAQGGVLVSSAYESARSLMTWRCHRGHEWTASADNLRNKGSWCPTCAIAARAGRPRTRRQAANT